MQDHTRLLNLPYPLLFVDEKNSPGNPSIGLGQDLTVATFPKMQEVQNTWIEL